MPNLSFHLDNISRAWWISQQKKGSVLEKNILPVKNETEIALVGVIRIDDSVLPYGFLWCLHRMEVQALQAQLQRAQNEIAQKDAKVVKLKGLLTRSMRSDKRREQQIESLQIDLADKVRHIEALNQ